MDLEVEGDVAWFLGVHIQQNDDKIILLSQPGPTKRVSDALNIEHLPVNTHPVLLTHWLKMKTVTRLMELTVTCNSISRITHALT
jgi:hypothetical protein